MKQFITTLANGLRIVTTEMTESESVVATIVVGTGSRYEDFNVTGGVSHFLEHLLFKGTAKYPSIEAISLAVDEVGGYNNAYTSEDVTNYYIKVPKRYGKLALEILADMVQHPLVDATELEKERGIIIEEMNVWRDDPARYVSTLIPPLLFAGNSLGQDTFGPEVVINHVPRETILAYMQSHYRPGNMVVAVAGRIKHDMVVAEVEKWMGAMSDGPTPAFEPVSTPVSTTLSRALTKDTNQVHFCIAGRGYAYNHDRDVAARSVAAILGRGASSRLFVEVRDRQGLAYTVMTNYQNYIDTGLFETYAGVNLDKAEQAIDSVLHELDLIRRVPVTEAELHKAQQQLIASLEMSLESNSNVADRTGNLLTLLGEITTVEQVVAEIEAVTIAQIQATAREMLAPSRLRFACIGPEAEAAALHFERSITNYKD